MKSTIASIIAVTFTTIGFAIGCVIWAAIGWCLGTAFSHAPVSGALTGIAYQTWSFLYLRDEIWARTERSHAALVQVLERL